ADDVIPDEFGSSIEIFTRVLQKYDVLIDDIAQYIRDQRTENYEILRFLYREPTMFSELNKPFTDIQTVSFKVGKHSPLVDKTLMQSSLRKEYKVTVLLIQRGGKMISNPDALTVIFAGDLFILMGATDDLSAAAHLFRSRREPHVEEES
ncbi:MAG: TrkA C-terminal domain-containing protein, partial [Chlamydiota bacterium]